MVCVVCVVSKKPSPYMIMSTILQTIVLEKRNADGSWPRQTQ